MWLVAPVICDLDLVCYVFSQATISCRYHSLSVGEQGPFLPPFLCMCITNLSWTTVTVNLNFQLV